MLQESHLLSDENGFQRKEWIDQRLKELNSIFSISVGGFSTMDNHLHLLLRIDCEEAENWSDQEVVEGHEKNKKGHAQHIAFFTNHMPSTM
jgi:hypothetical protein